MDENDQLKAGTRPHDPKSGTQPVLQFVSRNRNTSNINIGQNTEGTPRLQSADPVVSPSEIGKRTAAKLLPIAPPWIEIEVKEDDRSILIGPGRWLTRGSGCLVVAATGL